MSMGEGWERRQAALTATTTATTIHRTSTSTSTHSSTSSTTTHPRLPPPRLPLLPPLLPRHHHHRTLHIMQPSIASTHTEGHPATPTMEGMEGCRRPTTPTSTPTSTPTPTTSATTSNVITFGHRGKRQKRQQHKVHEHAVQQLHDRGFTNAAQVENALRHHGGNVARTLSALVQSREAFPSEVTSSRVSTVTHRRKPLTTKRIDAPGLTLLMSQGLWLVES